MAWRVREWVRHPGWDARCSWGLVWGTRCVPLAGTAAAQSPVPLEMQEVWGQ